MEEKVLVRSDIDEAKIDYGDCGVFHRFYIDPRVNFCLVMNMELLKKKEYLTVLGLQINCWNEYIFPVYWDVSQFLENFKSGGRKRLRIEF